MSYQSIDQIQRLLSDTVFAHTISSKKAAGRALGTFVEIIGFYFLKAWGHEYNIAIEKSCLNMRIQRLLIALSLHFIRIDTLPKCLCRM